MAALSVALGLLVDSRCPQSPVGAGLVLLGAAPTLVSAVEAWAASAQSAAALPAAVVVARWAQGAWVFNLAGFVVLASRFPSGRLPGWRWAFVPWAFVGIGAGSGMCWMMGVFGGAAGRPADPLHLGPAIATGT